jgi:hypothetical protein
MIIFTSLAKSAMIYGFPDYDSDGVDADVSEADETRQDWTFERLLRQ